MSIDWPRDPHGLWNWLRGAVVALMIGLCVSIGTDVYELVAKPDVKAPTPSVVIWLIASLGENILTLAALAFCIVLTPRLTYRLMRNVRALGHETATSPAWAAAFYFVPFANLVMPARVLGQIWRGTFGRVRHPYGFITLWWTCWVLWNLLSSLSLRFGGAFSQKPVNAYRQEASLITGIEADAVMLISCAAMLVVFGRIARAQRHAVRGVRLRARQI